MAAKNPMLYPCGQKEGGHVMDTAQINWEVYSIPRKPLNVQLLGGVQQEKEKIKKGKNKNQFLLYFGYKEYLCEFSSFFSKQNQNNNVLG